MNNLILNFTHYEKGLHILTITKFFRSRLGSNQT
jgi:hypothetical protein